MNLKRGDKVWVRGDVLISPTSEPGYEIKDPEGWVTDVWVDRDGNNPTYSVWLEEPDVFIRPSTDNIFLAPVL
jgi:hypothetical protein